MSVSSLAPRVVVGVAFMVSFSGAVVIISSTTAAPTVPIAFTVSFAISVANLFVTVRSVSGHHWFSVASSYSATLISTAVKPWRATRAATIISFTTSTVPIATTPVAIVRSSTVDRPGSVPTTIPTRP